MKAVVVGAAGQLGRALVAGAPSGAHVIAYDRSDLDITAKEQVDSAIATCEPDVVFNAAAYTAVDKAESEPDKAHAINADAVGYLAEASHNAGAKFVHVSTDFVFSGKDSVPYLPDAATAPLGIYGATKLAGEQEAAKADNSLIVRTAWVYDRMGRNFVNTMLRLMRERDTLSVVADQIGTPTLTDDLASALWQLADENAQGTFHFTNSGVASWYDFAVAIQEEAMATGSLDHAIPVLPIRTRDYPTPAARPCYSVLDCSKTYETLGKPARHWRQALRSIFEDND